MSDMLEKILSFHCPRYEELPDLEIYMDQVLQLLDRYLSLLSDLNEERIMTKTMINNYVKHGIVRPPVKKKYTREHLAYLIVIGVLKQVYSMNEISLLIQFQMKAYPIERAYNYFCDELEQCIKAVITHQPIEHAKASNQDEFEVSVMQNSILSIVEKLYVQLSMDEIRRRLVDAENKNISQ